MRSEMKSHFKIEKAKKRQPAEICLMMEMSKSSYYREFENIRQMIGNEKF